MQSDRTPLAEGSVRRDSTDRRTAMTTSKKFKAGENFTRAADAPPDAHALITTIRERPVQFLDIGRNNDAAHVALVNRAAQLEQIKNKRGDLSADEQEEQARIHHLLANELGLFDPLFVAVDAMLGSIE